MKNKQKHFSIGNKIYLFVGITVFIAGLVVAIMSYLINAGRINRYFSELSLDTARYVATIIDADEMLRLKEIAASEEYQSLRETAEEEDDEQVIEDYFREKGIWEEYSAARTLISDYLRKMENIEYLLHNCLRRCECHA